MRWLIILFLFVKCLAHSHTQPDLIKYSYVRPMMGTSFKIVLYSSSQNVADQAAQAAFHKVEELNQIFSNYLENSEVSLLTQSAETASVEVSEELWKVLVKSEELKENSQGVFDISIGRLTKLWRRSIRRQEMPDHQLIKDLISRDSTSITLNKDKKLVRLSEDVLLDFGGIAKGFAVDEVYGVLLKHGISMALIDGGGDIYAGQAPPGKSGWKLKVEGADETIIIEHEAVASSGSTYQYIYHNDIKYSHIIDPRSGYGVTDPEPTAVIALSCMMADAAASILSILQKEDERSAFLMQYPDVMVLP